MSFLNFKAAVNEQLNKISAYNGAELFTVELEDKNTLWDLYLASFPEGTNPIFRERTEHDCNCCKQFIRNIGNVVAVVNGKIQTIWDVTGLEDGKGYREVADALAKKVKSLPISGVYRNDSKKVGTNYSLEINDTGTIEWDHFYFELSSQYVLPKDQLATYHGNVRTNKQVLQRSLEEISKESIDVVIELIEQNSLYRGEEHLALVKKLSQVKTKYDDNPSDLYLWYTSLNLGEVSKFRNTVIGTLLVDLSEGTPLEIAVKKFEDKVAPHNYKRPTALITKGMIQKAEKKVEELGLSASLSRRYAVTEDVTINNVLFADRSAKKVMGVFDELQESVADKAPNLDKVKEVAVKDFLDNILPKAETLEVFVKNEYQNNLTSLIAPVDKDSKGMFKWGNNFSWNYNGEVADSMKDRVKKHGGNVDGALRFSIQWNEDGKNENDLDAHCLEPMGTRITFQVKGRRLPSSGMLDVDIVNPNGKTAVENIIYTDKSKMPVGEYQFIVHNYSGREGVGFQAEVEFDGKIYSYNCPKKMRENEQIVVADVLLQEDGTFKIRHRLESSCTPKEVWGITTEKWHKVNMVMNSPNHWDGEETGNRHLFFVVDKCANPDKARGFYNEFLTNELTPHRKVFEVLASKMKTPESENQLSGLGFSSTQENSVLVKVGGNFNRVIKVVF